MKTKINTIFRSIQAFGELCHWSPEQQDFWYQYLENFSNRIEHQGLAEAVKWNKTVRLCFTKAVVGDNNRPSDLAVSKTSKIPKVLTPLRGILDTREGQRQVLTALTFARAIEPRELNSAGIDKITAPGSIDPVVVGCMTSHLGSFLRSMSITAPVSIQWNGKWIATSKSGPNGHAMKSMYVDLASIEIEQIKALETLGGDSYRLALNQNMNIGPHLAWWKKWKLLFQVNEGSGSFGKLQIIPDSELKTRFIALGNYWVQNALKPLHDFQFNLLRRLRSDCTYDQGKAPRVLNQNPGHHFWSIDLSNATERFPREVQRVLLSELCSPEYADAWDKIISDPITFKGKKVRFEAGQPMGYYSSWATFSLCHHWVVHTACKMAGIHPKGNYVLLGDDIVISHDEVARNYRYLVQGLGVELNMGKTHVSARHYEFAKRWYAHGEGEWSPFPIKAVINAAHTSDILHALYTGHQKGWFLTECPIKMASVLIAGLFENYSEGFSAHSSRVATILHVTMQASINKISWADAFKTLAGTFNLEIEFPSDTNQIVDIIFRIDVLRQGLKRTFAGKWMVDGWALGDGIPRETLNQTLSPESMVPYLPHASISREVITYFTNELKFVDFSETLRAVITKNQRSVLVKDLSTLFTERNQGMDWASCLKFGKYLVSTLKQVSRIEEEQRLDINAWYRLIIRKHLDDWGVISLIDHNFPDFRHVTMEEIKGYYEKTQGEPLDQEDFDWLLETGFGYNESKGQIRGLQFKKGSPPMNYTFHMLALAQIRANEAG